VQFAFDRPDDQRTGGANDGHAGLEPIFEADLPPEQYAYRRGRDAREAVKAVRALLASGTRK